MACKTANELREALRRAPPDFSIAATVAAADEIELTDEFYRVDIDGLAVVTRRGALAQAAFLGERARREAEGRRHARVVRGAQGDASQRIVVRCPCVATLRLRATSIPGPDPAPEPPRKTHCRHCTHPLLFVASGVRTASSPPV